MIRVLREEDAFWRLLGYDDVIYYKKEKEHPPFLTLFLAVVRTIQKE
jgi:hypothetical protein